MRAEKKCTICGGGLVGSLLAIYLIQRGFQVRVIEKRKDPRTSSVNEGRSINLAISHRGLHALKKAFPGLDEKALALSVPMYGRRIHDPEGNLTFQPYSASGEHIHSIDRSDLNQLLIRQAEALGVTFYFGYACESHDPATGSWAFASKTNPPILADNREWLIGADGAFSAVRQWLQRSAGCSVTIDALDYGYKEIDIRAEYGKQIADKEALHIWPRERFMLIALPNPDGSYTATLFLPLQGERSFATLEKDEEVHAFFQEHFKDTMALLPDLMEQFRSHPVSRLSYVHTMPWNQDQVLLIGDAAHAMVPFYGQGMNAGFEDCRVLAALLDEQEHADPAFIGARFFEERKIHTDAISDLALQNFIEMRDLVADKEFLIRKKIEAFLHQSLPAQYIPQYTMVSFTDTPYAEAMAKGIIHQQLLNEAMLLPDITEEWPNAVLQQQVLALTSRYI